MTATASYLPHTYLTASGRICMRAILIEAGRRNRLLRWWDRHQGDVWAEAERQARFVWEVAEMGREAAEERLADLQDALRRTDYIDDAGRRRREQEDAQAQIEGLSIGLAFLPAPAPVALVVTLPLPLPLAA